MGSAPGIPQVGLGSLLGPRVVGIGGTMWAILQKHVAPTSEGLTQGAQEDGGEPTYPQCHLSSHLPSPNQMAP